MELEPFPYWSRWIHTPVFPESNPGGGNVDSAFHPSEIGEMSSSVSKAAQVYRRCMDRQISPGELPSVRLRVRTAEAGMCRRVGLQCIMRMTLCVAVMWNYACLKTKQEKRNILMYNTNKLNTRSYHYIICVCFLLPVAFFLYLLPMPPPSSCACFPWPLPIFLKKLYYICAYF